MGWLGYFVGRNKHLTDLYFRSFDNMNIDIIKPFIMGVNNNKTITTLDLGSMDLLDGRIFTMMGPFFENNYNLSNLSIHRCHLGDDGWRLLALVIGSSKHKSLKNVELSQNNISDEALVDIITSLSMHPLLNQLILSGNHLNVKGCKTLATLLQHSATDLDDLDLGDNELDDEGIEALVPALKNSSPLKTLRLSRNRSITTKGWKQLASILEAPNSTKLKELRIVSNDIDDQARTTFVNALVNNDTFKKLYGIGINSQMTIESEAGQALLKLLCDKSSINSTYQSNHTLEYINISPETGSASLRSLLELNKKENKKEVAMIKILTHHNDFDMMPFFEWEFKVLPQMIDWFERASAIPRRPENYDYEPNIGPRKLSSIYQFVRGMPLLYVETRLRQELEEIKVAQAQMEERKRGILERLGRNA